MAQFIFTNILMISLGTILYLMVRSLPRISEEPGDRRPSIVERWVTSDIPHRIDTAVSFYAGKLFRRMKVLSLKFDNFLTERLKKMSQDGNGGGITGQNKTKVDFIKEIANEREETNVR